MNTTSKTTTITQITALAAQGINQFGGLVPPKAQPFVALGLGLAQLFGAFIAHRSNPDGTPAPKA